MELESPHAAAADGPAPFLCTRVQRSHPLLLLPGLGLTLRALLPSEHTPVGSQSCFKTIVYKQKKDNLEPHVHLLVLVLKESDEN